MMTFRGHAARLAALLVMVVLYGFAQLPEVPLTERQQLAQHFQFTQVELPEVPGPEKHSVRPVNPNLTHLSGWISAVGAAVALNDLDGDGLSNDVCYVEVRTNQMIVAPAPGTSARYQPFTLTAAPLPYDDDTMAPMGCLPGDLNEDGKMDVVVYYWGRTPLAFLRVEQGYQPVEIAAQVERWFTNAAVLTDLDGDGHTDLVIANYFADGARILDAKAQVPDTMQHSMSRAYNAGGKYFFLWANATTATATTKLSVSFKAVPSGLDETFNRGWTLALGAADLDGDLLPELYFANDFGPDRFLHNRSTPGHLQFALLKGKREFTTPASRVAGRDSFKGMGVDFADINGDGLLDIFVSNIAAEYALEESHFLYVSTGHVEQMREGIAPYVDKGESLGVSRSNWSWDVKFADFDNDGSPEAIQTTGFLKGKTDRWPELQELALGNDELLPHSYFWPRFQAGDDLSGHAHNPFYTQTAQGRYVDIAAEVSLDQPYVSRGVATADVDGDGDLDFALANQWEPSYFYRNDCPQCGSFLGLHIRIPTTSTEKGTITTYAGHPRNPSRPAIGAAVEVNLPNGHKLVAQVDGGNGHSGRRSPDMHFGLGAAPADTPLKVNVQWRDRHGKVRRQELPLLAGWHTLELNW